MFPTLYKRDTTGRVRQWDIEVQGNKYRVTAGLVDGQKVTAEWTVCEGKNIGRANETTPEAQAIAEAKAHWTKKTQQGGYHENIDDIDTPVFYEPMTAKKYEDVKFDFPVDAQPKLDGMRCIVKSDGMWSRKGKPIVSAPHIFETLKPLFEDDPDLILDGELYNHDLKDNFSKIMSLCRKTKPTPADLEESAKMVQFWMYDIPSCDGDYRDRLEYAQILFERRIDVIGEDCIVWCPTDLCRNQEELDKYFEEYLDDGFEGQIIRQHGFDYENKRSKGLLKRKTFEDAEFRIVDITEGTGNRTGMAGRVFFEKLDRTPWEIENPNDDPYTCKASMIGNWEFCREVLRDKDQYIGTIATINFQKNSMPGGKPRFGRAKYLYKGERDV